MTQNDKLQVLEDTLALYMHCVKMARATLEDIVKPVTPSLDPKVVVRWHQEWAQDRLSQIDSLIAEAMFRRQFITKE